MTSGTPFGRYELLKPIATGGMAEVFLARTLGASGFEKELVIKRILPEFSSDPQFVKMFVDEARIAAQLHHPNVVQVFDFDEVDGTSFIAMEYVEGRDLRTLMEHLSLRGARLELAESLYIVTEVAKALDYAHRRRVHGKPLAIIHRDVSPHNVLVSFEGVVKLGDFGIAKAASRVTRTQDGVVKGKTAYMSPEQARGHTLTAASDLFSLGTVFFELVTMRRLFFADNDREVLRKVIAAHVPSPRSFNRKLPNEVERIILKLLARPLGKRYSSASELLGDLGPAYHKAAQSSPELTLRRRLSELFPQPERSSPADDQPGSWPPESGWPSSGATPILPGSAHVGPQTPPPMATERVSARGTLALPEPPTESRATPLIDDDDPTGVIDPFARLAEADTRLSGPSAPEADPEDTDPIERPMLHEEGTLLYPEEAGAATRPYRRAPSSTSRLGRRLAVAAVLVVIGVLVGVLTAVIRHHPSEATDVAQPTPDAGSLPEAGVAAASAEGTVIIRTDPSGASVLVDGDRLPGQTPVALSLPLDRSTPVTVEREGYQTERFRVTATDVDEPVERLIRLTPIPSP